jgi:hypothetical protein
MTDSPQPDSPQPDSPQPDSGQPDSQQANLEHASLEQPEIPPLADQVESSALHGMLTGLFYGYRNPVNIAILAAADLNMQRTTHRAVAAIVEAQQLATEQAEDSAEGLTAGAEAQIPD